MKRILLLLALASAACTTLARADEMMSSVQQALKDQGFYYGEITGQKDADTTAALRRYQIRNGLKITGELNAETQKSLGVKGALAEATPRPTATPIRYGTPYPQRSLAEVREPAPEPAPIETRAGIFDGTPYQGAPLQVQQQVLVGAQARLARQGYYRSAIDGIYGPGMAFALRAYQTRFGIEASGRLDMETLASLGLLPGQQAPGITAPRRGGYRRPVAVAPGGEPIYDGR